MPKLGKGSIAHRLLKVALVLGSLAAIASAQEAELITDRPDQTESAAIVPRGTVQIETGWSLTGVELLEPGEAVDVETHEVAGTLVRIGLSRRFELRLGWGGLVWEDVTRRGRPGLSRHGIADASLGGKVLLREERGRAPQMALLVGATVPVGDEEFSSGRVDPDFRLSIAHTLSERLSLGYNVGLAWASEELGGERTTLGSALYTLSLGASLSERVGAFVEVFGELAGSADGAPANALDGGVTWQLRPNFQLDASAGVGLSDAAPDWFVGLGVSVRLPR